MAQLFTQYAYAQHLPPNYFNNAIKSKSGKVIDTRIAEKTIMEAKSLRRNSALPIKDISSMLGFTESVHFSNYFKKHTNHSPHHLEKRLMCLAQWIMRENHFPE